MADRHDTVGHRPGGHERQRSAGPRRRAALLPRLHRHRASSTPRRVEAIVRGHGGGVPAGRLRADRRRDRRAARTLRAGRVRPGGLRRRRGGAGAASSTARAVEPGDVVLGLASSGLHSNGYQPGPPHRLRRAGLGLDAILPGHRPAARRGAAGADADLRARRAALRRAAGARDGAHHRRRHHRQSPARAARRLPRADRRRAWTVPPVFTALRDAGGVAEAEMFRTFNMGIGYLLVVPSAQEPRWRRRCGRR